MPFLPNFLSIFLPQNSIVINTVNYQQPIKCLRGPKKQSLYRYQGISAGSPPDYLPYALFLDLGVVTKGAVRLYMSIKYKLHIKQVNIYFSVLYDNFMR